MAPRESLPCLIQAFALALALLGTVRLPGPINLTNAHFGVEVPLGLQDEPAETLQPGLVVDWVIIVGRRR